MRVVIDLQGSQSESRFRGIGRYTLALAQAMVRQAGEHEVWLILNAAFPDSIETIRLAFDTVIPAQRIRIFAVPTPVAESNPDNAWRARAAEKIREHAIQQIQPDIVLLGSLFEGYLDDAVTSVGAYSSAIPTAVILYDLIPWLNPAAYLPTVSQKHYYQRKIDSLKNADLLLAISEHSKREALDALGFQSDRIESISTAVDAGFKPDDSSMQRMAKLRQEFGITRNFILYAPGGFDARKNIDGLITAYSQLPHPLRSTHQLVIASKVPETAGHQLTQLGERLGLAENQLLLTGYLSDQDLIAMYSAATLFVFPSKHEGFGLPVLEAMACGAPVIGANTTSIPEVVGLQEALFNPESPRDIMEKMAQVLSDESFRQHLRQHAMSQAGKFSWDETAKRAIKALENCVQQKQSALPPVIGAGSLPSLVQAIAGIESSAAVAESELVSVADCIAFNMGPERPSQLMLDISDLVKNDAKSGIQRVIRSILRQLLQNPPPEVDVKAIYFDGMRYRYANRFIVGFLAEEEAGQDVSDEIVDFAQDDIYLSLDLNLHMAPTVHNLFLQLRSRGVKLYFIVYDILLLQRPDWWPEGVSAIFETWLRSLADVATGLICISAAVAEDVRVWLSEHPPARLVGPALGSFHLGADIENSNPTLGMPVNAVQALVKLSATPSFLMVGTIEPRKGYVQALAAFERLWQQGHEIQLVIVGKQGWLMDRFANALRTHPELNKRLFWLEGISDEYLQKVYAACTCLIAASEGEGFGLPLIEAAQHQMPILARDLPVFREVAGEYAFYFTGLEPQDLEHAVKAWLLLNNQNNAPQSVDMPWLTWRQSARQLTEQLFPTSITQGHP